MGTRSRIGYQMASGKIKSVYCHSDGYPSFTGVRLRDHYADDVKKVRQLVAVGYLSVLEATPEDSAMAAHNKGIKPSTDAGPDEFYDNGRNYSGAEFVYYIQQDGMILGSVVGGDPNWMPLDMLIEKFPD